MNRFAVLLLVGSMSLTLASCGGSSSTKNPGSAQNSNTTGYYINVAPTKLSLSAGDFASVTATLKNENGTAVTPQPEMTFTSSDPHVSVSAAGEVCAGVWDAKFQKCTATDLPSGEVTIKAYSYSYNLTGTSTVTVHKPVDAITLTAPSVECVSQNSQWQYTAHAFSKGEDITSTIPDFDWSVSDATVAQVSSTGAVAARNPGVTNVYASVSNVKSTPLAFVTCPVSVIQLTPPSGTSLEFSMNRGDEVTLTTTAFDRNGTQLLTSPYNYLVTNPLTGSFDSSSVVTSDVTAISSGRFSALASCAPPTCNAAVANFTSPAGPRTGQQLGFGYPVYSNLVGVSVAGTTASSVVVTGDKYVDGGDNHQLLVFGSEALDLQATIPLPNLPNSLVLDAQGKTAYVGSDDGLMNVDLTTKTAAVKTYPVTGGTTDDVVSGKVLRISSDGKYIITSDVKNGYVFLIDTVTAKAAQRFRIAGIRAAAIAPDNSGIWIAGDSGVYRFTNDTFLPVAGNTSSAVTSLEWTPDGRSYFAGGAAVDSYATCNDAHLQTLPGSPINLASTDLGGTAHVIGLTTTQWLDIPVTSAKENTCPPTVSATSTPVAAGLACTPTQMTFNLSAQKAFVTGVDPACGTDAAVHGLDLTTDTPFTLAPAAPITPLSGSALTDGSRLFIGSSEGGKAALHSFNLSSGAEDNSVSLDFIPNFVAVVPK